MILAADVTNDLPELAESGLKLALSAALLVVADHPDESTRRMLVLEMVRRALALARDGRPVGPNSREVFIIGSGRRAPLHLVVINDPDSTRMGICSWWEVALSNGNVDLDVREWRASWVH